MIKNAFFRRKKYASKKLYLEKICISNLVKNP